MTSSYPKVKLEDLEALIDNAENEEYIFFDKVLVIEYLINPFFSVQGRAACVVKENFNIYVGRDICRKDAISKLWSLEGYALSKIIE